MPRTIAVKVKYEMWVTYHVTINNKTEHEDESKQFEVDEEKAIECVTRNCDVQAIEQDGDWKMYTEVPWMLTEKGQDPMHIYIYDYNYWGPNPTEKSVSMYYDTEVVHD